MYPLPSIRTSPAAYDSESEQVGNLRGLTASRTIGPRQVAKSDPGLRHPFVLNLSWTLNHNYG